MRRVCITMVGIAGATGGAPQAWGQPLLALRPLATLPPGVHPYVTSITGVPGDPDTLWVTVRRGDVYRVSISTGAVSGPLLTLPVVVGGESGLIGLAFHPSFETSGRFFVTHNRARGLRNVISEFRFDPQTPDRIDAATERPILYYGMVSVHVAGWIGFDAAGLFYCAIGENGGLLAAQDLTDEYRGKILRIDVDRDDFPLDPERNYGLPPANPFATLPGAEAVYLYGLRNPWRCAIDRETGDLWVADVGDRALGEIIVQRADEPAGGNYGWPCFDGNAPFLPCDPAPPQTPSLLTITSLGDRPHQAATIGGALYRGDALPSLRGFYVYGDYIAPAVFTLTDAHPPIRSVSRIGISAITTFGEDTRGELYVGDTAGRIYAITCGADFNTDGMIDFFDLLDYLDCFDGHCPDPTRADLNADGFTDFFDVLRFIDGFERGC